MMSRFTVVQRRNAMLLATVLVSGILVSTAVAQSTAPAPKRVSTGSPVRYLPNELPRRAQMFYQGIWGIDQPRVSLAESGELVKFTWRVLDPLKAKALNDKKAEPFLIDPRARVKLVVPTMEKVGQLRQSSTPEAGNSYWMAFSNSGRPVKRGDRVDVVIGNFRAIGLVVE